MKIYHGGCHGCINQDEKGIHYCNDCRYRKANWNLPNLSSNNKQLKTNRMEKIRVKVLKNAGWARKDEIHEVGNYICFNWTEGVPYFEKGKGSCGIECSNCKIMPLEKIIKFDGVEYSESTLRSMIKKATE